MEKSVWKCSRRREGNLEKEGNGELVAEMQGGGGQGAVEVRKWTQGQGLLFQEVW